MKKMLNDLSKEIRREILTEAYKHKHGHIASCFSCVEILLAIKEIMKPEDFFILSKGHAILAEIAVFGKEISCFKTGSLGHGIGVGAGIALANPESNVYVVVGDGELQEGSSLEALNFIMGPAFDRDNLIVLIDENHFQASRKIHWPLHKDYIGKSCVSLVDGHRPDKIIEEIQFNYRILFCETTKGMGVSFIEANPVRFHTDICTEIEQSQALQELS
jgi:transketolase